MKTLVLLFCLLLTLPAKSALFLEPYLGLGMATSGDIEGPEATFEGLSINPGLKIGTTTMFTFVSFGAEFSYQDSTAEARPSGRELDLTRTDFSAFALFEFPILFRIFGKYIVGSSMTIGNTDMIDPDGYGLGVGYTGLPFLSLNLEYRTISWKKIKNNDVESNANGEITEIILSLSFPLKI